MSELIKLGNKDMSFVYKGNELVYPNPVQDGLVLWYDFSGMSNSDTGRGIAKDLSGNENHGTLQNFNYTSESGYNGKGLKFDGVDDSVSSPPISSYEVEHSTYEIVLDFTQTDKTYQRILERHNYWVDGLFFSGNGFRSFLTLSGGSVSQIVAFQQQKMTHVVRTLNLSEGKVDIYINGELKDSRDDLSGTLDDRANSGSLLIGTSSLVSNVRTLKIYNRPLTPSEIAHNYAIEKQRFNIQEEN